MCILSELFSSKQELEGIFAVFLKNNEIFNVSYETIKKINSPQNTLCRYFIFFMISYDNFSSVPSKISRISDLSSFWIEGLSANSYKALLIVVEDVSNPAAKNTQA